MEATWLVLIGLCALGGLFMALMATGTFELWFSVMPLGTFSSWYMSLFLGAGSLLAIGAVIARILLLRRTFQGERKIVIDDDSIRMPVPKKEHTSETIAFSDIMAADWKGEEANSSVIVVRTADSRMFLVRQSWLGSKEDLLDIGEALQTAVSRKRI